MLVDVFCHVTFQTVLSIYIFFLIIFLSFVWKHYVLLCLFVCFLNVLQCILKVKASFKFRNSPQCYDFELVNSLECQEVKNFELISL